MADTEGTTGTGADGFDFRAVHGRIASLWEKQIFFVGGAVKSGTTWLQALLDGHPRVSCAGENHFVNHLSPTLKKTLEAHNAILLDARGNTAYQLGKAPTLFEGDEFRYVLASAILAILLKQAGQKPVLAVGDKSTMNVQVFSLLATIIPGSKCIQIVRDPRDAAVSGWHHITRIFPERAKESFPSLAVYAKEYADVWTLEVGRGVGFGARHPGRYHELRYEDLVERPLPTLAGAFRFLGVDDGEAVVRGAIEAASFERLSGGRARGEEDTRSFFRKGTVGDWKNHLDAETVEHVVAKCGALMQRFGYL